MAGLVGVGLGGGQNDLPSGSVVYMRPLKTINMPSMWAKVVPLTPDQYNLNNLEAKKTGKVTTYYREGKPEYVEYLRKLFSLSEGCFNNRFFPESSLYYYECTSLADLKIVGAIYNLDKNIFKNDIRLLGAEAGKLYVTPVRYDSTELKKSEIPVNLAFPTPIIDVLDLTQNTTIRYIFNNPDEKYFTRIKICTALGFLDERRGLSIDKIAKGKIYLRAAKLGNNQAEDPECHFGFIFDLTKKVGRYYSW
ncbi:hypothetical protein [Deinococcus altitudinis]|uniref:hypothetical protein n=1 Tax=Deinococcus altitudinis TaxID=468914 RepID=UPI003892015A